MWGAICDRQDVSPAVLILVAVFFVMAVATAVKVNPAIQKSLLLLVVSGIFTCVATVVIGTIAFLSEWGGRDLQSRLLILGVAYLYMLSFFFFRTQAAT